MRGDRQNHTRSPWLHAGLLITYSFMNEQILEIKKIIREIKRRNFENQKIIREIKRTNFGNQKIIREIKRTRQESKHIIILVILLEHRT